MIKILKPTQPGETLRDPATGRDLPFEGKAVAMTTFWRRRLEDGSVTEVAPSEPSPAPRAEEAQKKVISTKKVKEPDNGLAE